MTKTKRKYCPAAQSMLESLARGRSRKWNNTGSVVTALEKHYEHCKRGCGRDLTGVPWPPK